MNIGAFVSESTKVKLVIAFVLIFISLSSIFAFFEARIYYQRRENNLYLASNQARLIEGSLDTVMSRVYTLSALVSTNHGDTKFFEEAGKEICIPEAPDMRLSVSVGGVCGDGTDTYYDLFSKADEQVYISKEEGKNQYHIV